MITRELKQLVINEATNLKKYASAEERARLDFGQLDGSHSSLCVYGQMTRNCYSFEAIKLLDLCTKPYSKDLEDKIPAIYGNFNPFFGRRDFSPIEYYICQRKAKNKTLINFLKGETETLTIEEL